MDFDFSDDQEQLRDAVRKWVDKAYTFDRRREITQAGGFDRAAYTELAELGLCGLQAQLMLSFFSLCKVERAGLKDATRLSCFFFQRIIEVHCVMLNAADIRAVMQPMNIGRRMPC